MKNTIDRVNIMSGPQRHMNSVRALKILDKRKNEVLLRISGRDFWMPCSELLADELQVNDWIDCSVFTTNGQLSGLKFLGATHRKFIPTSPDAVEE